MLLTICPEGDGFHVQGDLEKMPDALLSDEEVESQEGVDDVLDEKDLVSGDTGNVGLYFHRKSKQWHGQYKGQKGRAPTFGALRSERKAILICILFLRQ